MKTPNKINICACLSLLLMLLLTANACKTTGKESSTALSAKSSNELLNIITTNTLQYNTLSCNLKANVKTGKDDKNISSNASLKLIKNEKIQLSFQPSILGIGFEAFRMIISKDSIILIDRMNKSYVAESITDVKKSASFDFDFFNIQALFTNQLFIAGQPEVTKNDYKRFSIEQSKYTALIKSKDRQNINYSFTTDYTDKIRSTQMSSKEGTTSLTWKYDDFAPVSTTPLFPMQMDMNLVSPKDEINMSFSFSKIDVDKKDVIIDFSIPQKYKQITLDQAIMIIKRIL